MVQDDAVRPRDEEAVGDHLPAVGITAAQSARGSRRLLQDLPRRHVHVPGVVDRLLALLGDSDDPLDLVAAVGALDA